MYCTSIPAVALARSVVKLVLPVLRDGLGEKYGLGRVSIAESLVLGQHL